MQKDVLETFFTPSQQCVLFLYSVLLGAALSIVYDFFRVFRAIIPHKSVMIALEDILFCIIWGLSLFVFSVELSRGEVRSYYFLGNIFGFFLCHFTVGNIIVGAVRKIVLTIKSVILFIYRILLAPIIKFLGLICQKITGFFVGIYSNFKKDINNKKILLKDTYRMMYNKPTHKIARNKKGKKEVKRLENNSRRKKEKRSVSQRTR